MTTRRYYGWTITWALAVTQTVGFGVLYYAFSVFVTPMEAELGWTRAETTGAFSVALLLSGLAAPLAGRLVDRRGARALMTLGSSLGALLVFLWSFTQTLTGFYLIQFGVGLAMAAVLYDVAFTVVAVWFRAHRTRALLVITLVAGLASTIFVPLSVLLVEAFGWRAALRVLALVLAVGTVPLHALVLRRRPQDLGLEPDGAVSTPLEAGQPEISVTTGQALRAPAFWWLSLAFALSRVTIVAVAAHGVPLLLERGYPHGLVAAALGSVGLWQLAGRLLFTPATAGISLKHLAAATFGVHALALVGLLTLPAALALWTFAALFGLANGAVTLARAALVAEQFGAAHYGSINGNLALLIALAQTTAPLGAGLLHDAFLSYIPVVWLLAAASMLAALAVLRVGPAQEGEKVAYAD